MSYPAFETLLKVEDEKDLMRVKRSFLSILSLCAKGFLSVVIVVLINLIFGGAIKLSYFWSELPDLSLRWLGIIPALLLLNVFREYHDDLYIFGMHGVTQHHGRLSLNKRVPHVKYSDILSIRVRQDPWGRILNYGDVDLDTAAQSGVEMVIQGVANPRELSHLTEQFRLNSVKTGMA